MADVTTLDHILIPLMDSPSIKRPCCAICGRRSPLEQHHIVRRSAGKLFRKGVEVKKPTITLCGFGNNLGYCHGLAHANRLHFRWVEEEINPKLEFRTETGGHLEYLITEEPISYINALDMEGWRQV